MAAIKSTPADGFALSGLASLDFVMWREVFLNENGVGFALQQQISVDRIVESDVENETDVVPDSGNGSKVISCMAPIHKKSACL